jgi:hypothetical protein
MSDTPGVGARAAAPTLRLPGADPGVEQLSPWPYTSIRTDRTERANQPRRRGDARSSAGARALGSGALVPIGPSGRSRSRPEPVGGRVEEGKHRSVRRAGPEAKEATDTMFTSQHPGPAPQLPAPLGAPFRAARSWRRNGAPARQRRSNNRGVARRIDGGRSGIRTHERVAPLTVFKTVAFVRSAILP